MGRSRTCPAVRRVYLGRTAGLRWPTTSVAARDCAALVRPCPATTAAFASGSHRRPPTATNVCRRAGHGCGDIRGFRSAATTTAWSTTQLGADSGRSAVAAPAYPGHPLHQLCTGHAATAADHREVPSATVLCSQEAAATAAAATSSLVRSSTATDLSTSTPTAGAHLQGPTVPPSRAAQGPGEPDPEHHRQQAITTREGTAAKLHGPLDAVSSDAASTSIGTTAAHPSLMVSRRPRCHNRCRCWLPF
mmetsp:Transcript_20412/g.70698  ORF Transcript_20412/g.70698 Transcript_20412/m.70698 type:complete len:248 (-) Transcript_20412:122-865(-)